MSRIIGFACLAVAGVSLFLPAYKAPFVGSVSLLQNWHGWLLLILLAASGVAVALNRDLWGRIAGGLALGLSVIFLVLLMQEFSQLKSQLGGLQGNKMSFSLSWSWYPLVAALIAFQVAPFLSKTQRAK